MGAIQVPFYSKHWPTSLISIESYPQVIYFIEIFPRRILYITIVHDWLMTSDSWRLWLDSLHLGWCMATHQRTHHVDEPPRPASSSTTRQRHLFECDLMCNHHFPPSFCGMFPQKNQKNAPSNGGNWWSGEARPNFFEDIIGYPKDSDQIRARFHPFPR